MQLSLTRAALIALVLGAAPAALSAQEAAAPAPAPAPAAPANEAQQIVARLGALQQQAMQDPAVKAASDSLDAVLLAVASRLDPNYAAAVARSDAFKAEVEAARAAGDNAKLNELAVEGEGLQQAIQSGQQAAMQDAEFQAARQAFMTTLFARMAQIDPEAPQLVARLNELNAQD